MTHSTFKCAAPALPSRRLFLTQALGTIGLVSLALAAPVCAADLLVSNITGLYSVSVAKIGRPSSTAEVAELVRKWPGRIAVGGGRYSMGGQTAVEGGLHVDMRSMNRLVWFRPQEKTIRVQRDVEALNVSIRHSPADAVGMLPWAREEVFCFVLYYKQRTHAKARADVGRWTRELIELALINEGRYYLPYQLHATSQQFRRAYPEADELARLKARVDPAGKFSNELWRRYL